jgi:hypothetical protein
MIKKVMNVCMSLPGEKEGSQAHQIVPACRCRRNRSSCCGSDSDAVRGFEDVHVFPQP